MASASPVPTSTTALPRVVFRRPCTRVTTGASATPTTTPTPMPVSTLSATDTIEKMAAARSAAAASVTNDHVSMSTIVRWGRPSSLPTRSAARSADTEWSSSPSGRAPFPGAATGSWSPSAGSSSTYVRYASEHRRGTARYGTHVAFIDPQEPRRTARITTRSAMMAVVVAALALVVQRVFVSAHRPLSWFAAAVVVAVLIDPIVDVLDRHMPRILAVV